MHKLAMTPAASMHKRSNSKKTDSAYEQLDLSVDIYNHVSIPEGKNFVNSLHSWYVECDGKLLAPSDIEQLYRDLSEVMVGISKRVEAMSWPMRTEKYAEIFWYSKKNLRDRLGKDWEVPDRVRTKIREGELKSSHRPMSESQLKILLRLSF